MTEERIDVKGRQVRKPFNAARRCLTMRLTHNETKIITKALKLLEAEALKNETMGYEVSFPSAATTRDFHNTFLHLRYRALCELDEPDAAKLSQE